MPPLRIIVADDDPFVRLYLELIVEKLGHEVMGLVETSADLTACCRNLRPDVIVGNALAPKVSGVYAHCGTCEESPVPMVYLSRERERRSDRTTMHHEYVLVDLEGALGETALRNAIDQVMTLHWHVCSHRASSRDAHDVASELRELRAAQVLLMRHRRVSASQAMAHLQKEAAQREESLLDVARRTLQDLSNVA